MPYGQWVAFSGYDTVHRCAEPSGYTAWSHPNPSEAQNFEGAGPSITEATSRTVFQASYATRPTDTSSPHGAGSWVENLVRHLWPSMPGDWLAGLAILAIILILAFS
jgi:hypothetical protein